jgi:hypothetical protein
MANHEGIQGVRLESTEGRICLDMGSASEDPQAAAEGEVAGTD